MSDLPLINMSTSTKGEILSHFAELEFTDPQGHKLTCSAEFLSLVDSLIASRPSPSDKNFEYSLSRYIEDDVNYSWWDNVSLHQFFVERCVADFLKGNVRMKIKGDRFIKIFPAERIGGYWAVASDQPLPKKELYHCAYGDQVLIAHGPTEEVVIEEIRMALPKPLITLKRLLSNWLAFRSSRLLLPPPRW